MKNDAVIETMETADLAAHIERQDAFAVDLREGSHGEQIYGSIRYAPKKLDEADRLVLPLPKGSGLVVLYDEDGTSDRTQEIARKFAAQGYGELRILAGGFAAWQAFGGRMQERTMEQPIPEVTGHQLER